MIDRSSNATPGDYRPTDARPAQPAEPDDARELLVAEATDAFLASAQVGGEPSVEVYAARYPEIADVLRRVLPALRAMGSAGGCAGPANGGGDVGEPGRSNAVQGAWIDSQAGGSSFGRSSSSRRGEPHATEPMATGPHNQESLSADTPALAGQLGDFRLIREVGRGGMGVVYEAEQVSLGRRVALKVLPMAAALDSRQLQRFRMEAQAAAHLHHSNIVPIYSVGCERGVYYYAMQFIQGRSVAEVIAALQARPRGPDRAGGRGANDGVKNRDLQDRNVETRDAETRDAEIQDPGQEAAADLDSSRRREQPDDASHDSRGARTGNRSTRDGRGGGRFSTHFGARDTVAQLAVGASTLQSIHSRSFFHSVALLGIQAADALEYAHAMGVVHRDIKPANLLLGDEATVYVADFGLAQLHGDSRLTFTGDLVGTLRYMSPEQTMARRGLVDHRSDIYSLGATLYELLTLTPAFDGADRHAVLREIVEEEPAPPRQRNKAIPVDLETIVLKALAKEPQRRYATAKEMSEDLTRFLDQRPIAARPPTLPERAARLIRRHRTLVGGVVCLLLLVAIGFGVSTALVTREQWKTQAAYDSLAREQQKTQAAYEAQAQQRQRAERAFRQARQIVDFFTEVSEEELADKAELQGLRRMLLAASLDYYQGFIADGADDPSLQAQLAASHLRVGGILSEIGGSRDEAMAALERARQIQEKLALNHPAAADVQNGLMNIYTRVDAIRGGRELSLLSQRPVQEDLKLDDAQVREINRLWEQRRRAFYEPRGLTPEEWRAKFDGLAAQEMSLADALRPEQRRRLSQLALQQRGMHAFNDPEVAAALGLTTEQLERIRPLERDTRELLAARFESGELRPEDWQAVKDSWRQAWEQVRGVLTDEQEQRWKELTGEPFQGKFAREGFPMRPPGFHARHASEGRGPDDRGSEGRGPGAHVRLGPEDRHDGGERAFDEHGARRRRHGSPPVGLPPADHQAEPPSQPGP